MLDENIVNIIQGRPGEFIHLTNLSSDSCCVYHIFFKFGSVVADIISSVWYIADNILISSVRTL
jgi:hypothetical protein